MKRLYRLILRNPLLFHLVFSLAIIVCLLTGMGLLYLAGFRFRELPAAFTDCFIFLLFVYSGRWLAIVYLKHRPWRLAASLLLALSLLSLLKWLLVRYIFNHPRAGYLEMLRDVMPFFLVGLLMGTLLKLVRVSVQKELREAKLETEQKAVEFNLLQAQLSPHFLFNTLNNLYGIAIAEHERIPALLLKLSQLLRYAVYGNQKQWVPLSDELDYIRNYMEFEKIRIGERLVLETSLPQMSNPTVKIAPMILIVFVENAFKHGKHTPSGEIYIRIRLQLQDGYICFEVANTYVKDITMTDLKEDAGIGLANTKRRLGLVYGDAYELTQKYQDGLYHIRLKLKHPI